MGAWSHIRKAATILSALAGIIAAVAAAWPLSTTASQSLPSVLIVSPEGKPCRGVVAVWGRSERVSDERGRLSYPATWEGEQVSFFEPENGTYLRDTQVLRSLSTIRIHCRTGEGQPNGSTGLSR